MNAQHKINKRNSRLRRINKQIEWWTLRFGGETIANDAEKKLTAVNLNRLNDLKELLEKEV